MRDLVSIRDKMGTEIRCHAVSGGSAYSHKGRTVHITADDIRRDPVASEAHFFAAWQSVTGFEPFTVCRWFRGRLRPIVVSFVPAGHQPVNMRRGWHDVAFKAAPHLAATTEA